MDFNTIKIKAGSGIPGPDVLSERELGWDKENKHLYIGTEDGPYQIDFSQNQEDIEDYLPLDGGTITGDLTIEGATTATNLTIEGAINFPNGSPFAPSGYGLGASFGYLLNDANLATLNAVYGASNPSTSVNFVKNDAQNYGPMLVLRRHGNVGQVSLFRNRLALRFSEDSGATWGEWEWINPPMELGVEYRTTERYNNKAVYKKKDSKGNLFWRVDGETTWRKDGSDPLDSMPVGYVYISFTATSPGELFGGDWERIQNTFLLAAGSTYAINTTGGAATHTLTVDEMPSHNHYVPNIKTTASDAGYAYAESWGNGSGSRNIYTNPSGGGKAHNNMPPYITVYMWKRVA